MHYQQRQCIINNDNALSTTTMHYQQQQCIINNDNALSTTTRKLINPAVFSPSTGRKYRAATINPDHTSALVTWLSLSYSLLLVRFIQSLNSHSSCMPCIPPIRSAFNHFFNHITVHSITLFNHNRCIQSLYSITSRFIQSLYSITSRCNQSLYSITSCWIQSLSEIILICCLIMLPFIGKFVLL